MSEALHRKTVRKAESLTTWWIRRDREVERLLERQWLRLGPRYWWPYWIGTVLGWVALWLVGLAIASLYVHLTAAQFWSLAAFESFCLAGAAVWTIVAIKRGPARPIHEWVEAGKPDDGRAAAWEAAVALPTQGIVKYGVWRYAVAAIIPLGVFVTLVLGRSWLVGLSATLALAGAGAAPAVLQYFVLDLFMWPVKRDAARGGVGKVDEARPLRSMRWRVLIALMAINDSTTTLATMLSSSGHIQLKTILLWQTVGVMVAGGVALGLSILATEWIVCPIDELVGAAEAIRAGDLSVRIPVASADELGILTSRFNAMAAELQVARERLVSAREEERRRVRRDLHDGLGPTLAALVIQLELASGLLGSDPAGAERVLGELKGQAQQAIGDIRRLVYELRPPSLDELGLVGAIRENAARLTCGSDGSGVALTLTAPPRLPQLPAAVEVAAFRIAQEAMTNVVRHAGARACTVELAVNGGLELLVSDDGRGIGEDHSAGVGLASMRERAAELGGSCTVAARPAGGTVVRASLPLPG